MRQRHATWSVGTSALVLLAALIFCLWDHPAESPSALSHTSPAPSAGRQLSALGRGQEERHEPALKAQPLPPQAPRVDPQKVRAALTHFNLTLRPITRAQLKAEQERLNEARERFLQVKVDEPRVEPFKDERGVAWHRLTYSSGEVRYEFPSFQ